MEITQDEVVDRQTVLHIELEEEDLVPYLDQGYRRVVQHAMIPGFRKGKAPRAVVERYLGRPSLLNEVIDFMVPEVAQRAIAAQDLETAGTPDVELLALEPVTLVATVALAPDVDLGAYKDIRVVEVPFEVTEEDVQEGLHKLQKDAAPWEPVERPVKLGDMLTLSAVGTIEGRSILEETDAVYVAEEGSAIPFLGFSGHLEGAVVGVPTNFDLVISDEYPDAELVGKEAHFEVTVSEIKERNLPPLDDEFAKSLDDGDESLAALRESVERDLKDEARNAQQTQYREAALDELLKVATVELPPMLVDHEVEHMVSKRDRFVDRLSIRMDDYLRFTGKTEEQIQKEMREHAIERFSRSYALATLAEHEGLEVSDEEIDEKVQEIAASDTKEGEDLKSQGLDSEEVMGSIREMLLMERALDRLTDIAGADPQEPSGQGESSHEEKQDPEDGGDKGDIQT